MELKYIFGVSSSGKSGLIRNEISKAVREEDCNAILIVPEQFTLKSEEDLLRHIGTGAMRKAEVLSFGRLAYRVFSEVGFNKDKNIGKITKSMLIRKLSRELSNELIYYGKSYSKHGFITETAELLTEFYRSGVKAEDLLSAASRPQVPDSLERKLTDISLLFERYDAYLKDGCISQDDTPDYLVRVISESNHVRNAKIWIDGFFGFTRQELAVIGQLLILCRRVTIALSLDENKIYFNNIADFEFFCETKRTVNNISELAGYDSHEGALRGGVSEPGITSVFLEGNDSGTELSFFSRNFCKETSAVYSDESNRQIFTAIYDNIYDETEEAANVIIHLVRDKGYRFREVAVLCADLDTYKKTVTGLFSLYGIPLFIDNRRDVLSHPLTEFIRALPRFLSEGRSVNSMVRLLRTGLFLADDNNEAGLTRDDLFDFENYCMEFGVFGKKWFYKELTIGFSSGRYDKERINGVKDYISDVIKTFAEGLERGAKLTVREFNIRLYGVLTCLNAESILQNWADAAARSSDNAAALYHKQIWGVLAHVFEEMTEIFGEDAVTVSEYSDLLESGLTVADMGIIPPSGDSVQIGDLNRTRLPQLKALVVMGLTEDSMQPPMNGLLSETERVYMRGEGIRLAETAPVWVANRRLYIYTLFSKPSDYLVVSYPASSSEGEANYPAVIFDELCKMFPNAVERFLPEPFIKPRRAALRDIGALLSRECDNPESDDISEAVLHAIMTDEKTRTAANIMKAIITGERMIQTLSSDIVEKLYTGDIVSSVSRLETYIRCPFSYFLKYNLRINERRLYKVDFLDLGAIFHAVLEEVQKLLDKDGKTLANVEDDDITSYTERAFDTVIKNDDRDIMGATASNTYLQKRIYDVASKSVWALSRHMKMGDFALYGMEIDFKSSVVTRIEASDGKDRRFTLQGRIDRVDIMDFGGKRYVKVIDFKSGAKEFTFEDVYYGMQLQLMLYLDSFMKIVGDKPEVLPGGVFYFNIGNPILNAQDIEHELSEDGTVDTEKLNERILDGFKMSGLLAADKDVAKGIDNEIEKTQWSRVVQNVRMTSNSETGFTDGSNTVTLDEFEMLCAYANDKMREITTDITKGRIDKRPYKSGGVTGCDYCPYMSVCRFDLVNETSKYRAFRKIGKASELVAKCGKRQ